MPMQPHALAQPAIVPLIELARGVRPDQLDAPTPCTEWTVRALLAHLVQWAPALEGAARKTPTPPGPNELGPDWPAALAAQLERTIEAWSAPAAWDGTTSVGEPAQLPAAMVGAMVLGEYVVHGWDLARATGQAAEWDGAVVEFLHRDLLNTAEMGRQMGLFRAAVDVPDDAPLLDRVLGLTGRRP
jgi:uncharacterized protein (TIGR03086 family)